MRRWIGFLLLVAAAAAPAHAQDPRLVQRLGAPAADSIARVMAAAERDGLPGVLLLDKALEGAARRAPTPRVLEAVANLASALRDAQRLLGPGHSADELAAGAAALQSGVAPGTLARLTHVSEGRSVALPLVVVTDLVTRGVPDAQSATLVSEAWRRGISEADLLRIRETISRDIASGITPLQAAVQRLGPPAAPSSRPIPGAVPLP